MGSLTRVCQSPWQHWLQQVRAPLPASDLPSVRRSTPRDRDASSGVSPGVFLVLVILLHRSSVSRVFHLVLQASACVGA